MEECEGKIGSSAMIIMYTTQKYGDTSLITLGWIGDERDGPTNHPPSPSNYHETCSIVLLVEGNEANGAP
jgi:hypothetical protein